MRNKAILFGNVGRDPEIRHTTDGRPISNFPLATSDHWKDKETGERKERTEWHRIVCFNDAINDKVIEPYVKKGSMVLVEGVIRTKKYTDKEGIERYATEIVIEQFNGSIELAGKPSGGNGPGFSDDPNAYGKTTTRETGQASAHAAATGGTAMRDFDDEVPF